MQSITRIAPTPSGFLHLGNVFSFLLTAWVAKKEKATMLLRIDDVDRQRSKNAYIENIFTVLELLEIDWLVGPKHAKDFKKNWSQTHRLPMYEKALQALAEKDLVFACTCSRKERGAMKKNNQMNCACLEKNYPLTKRNAAWRLKTSREEITFKGIDGVAEKAQLPAEMHHFVVRTKAGVPAYQLCSLVDDVHFGCTHIVRGEDLKASTLAQLALAKMLGFDSFGETRFLHHSLISHGDDKLSKSQKAPSLLKHLKACSTPQEVKLRVYQLLKEESAVQNTESLQWIANYLEVNK